MWFRLLICLLFLSGISACAHVQQRRRPVILLLEDARIEWAKLPISVRETFTENVQIREISVDKIVNNPQILDSVIGFICSDLPTFEPIRYLSCEPFSAADPDIALHLFRRKTYTEAYDMDFYLYDGQIIIGPLSHELPRCHTYRVNPSQLSLWTYWTVKTINIDRSFPRESFSDPEGVFESIGPIDPAWAWGPPEGLLNLPEPSPIPIPPAAEIYDELGYLFGHGWGFGDPSIRWRAPDRLFIHLYTAQIQRVEDLLYRIHTSPPGQ